MFLMIISFVIIILMELSELLRKRQFRELLAFGIFTLIALIISIFYVLRIPIFNPVEILQYIIKDLLHLNYR
ncbi:hypothetical protein [Clostridium fungisolvens]|uniref:Uncharacterized protein n=1 Tax=Clostridium fungisolvens TaxID=1604897 RepID=A0A6V8SKV2_9CLOT|nr:hypothetical protein [Clostridium fungisolvens]GFP77396.1 hypothetical protein bsdtw1_03524 [Clostridium fungisolvens]